MSKKKSLFSQCDRCGLHFLTSHLPKHPSDCEVNDETPKIETGKKICAVSVKLDKRKEHLPSSCLGWHRSHTVLVSSQALELAQVLPRTPCLLKVGETESLVVLWPFSELSGLKVNVENLTAEKVVNLEVVEHPLKLSSIVLEPLDPIELALLNAPYFKAFIQVYLSGAFISTNIPIPINFLAKTYKFRLLNSVSHVFSQLSLKDEAESVVYQVHTGAEIIFHGSKEVKKDITIISDPFKDVGGAQSAKKTFEEGLRPCSIILYGFTGCGKSLFLSAVEKKLGSQSVRANNFKEFNTLKSTLKLDSVFLLDFSPIQNDQNSFNDSICELLDSKVCLAIVLSLRSVDLLDLRVRRRFEVEVELLVPSTLEREVIFDLHLPKQFKDRAKELAMDSHGFTGADIETMCKKVGLLANGQHQNPVEEAKKLTNPTGIRQFILEVPNVSWENIGGNVELKKEIQQAVVWPYEHPEAFERLGVQPPNGILLYGPPGCSKTLIARALASQSKLNFLSVKGPELFSKWVGESERAVRDLFHRARQVSPAILFFDEVDAIAPKRGNDKSSAVSDRVLAQMLTELDGLEKSNRVFVVAATNRPDTLDSALLRPGRLDRSIYVPLPDYHTRKSIIEIQFKQIKVSNEVDVDQLSQLSEGYSGAELVALCRNAALCAMRQDLNIQEVGTLHFQQSFQLVLPRTDPTLLKLYQKFAKGDC